MKLYLLSIYQPDGGTPPPEVLAKVMAEIEVINRELRATNSWVFAGGLHPAERQPSFASRMMKRS
jgi:hypothetical protein